MFTQILEQLATSDNTQTKFVTDGQCTFTYAELPSILKSIGHYFLMQDIDLRHCIALECPNSVPGALTLLYLMEQGISFILLPPQENHLDLKPVPQFCHYRIAFNNTTSCINEDWKQKPEQFLNIESNAQFHPLPKGIKHVSGRLYLRTSGSMGTSKIVVHKHDNFIANARNCVIKCQLEYTDRAVIPIPLAHIYGLAAAFLPALTVGASIDLQNKTNHLQYLAREKEFKPNVAFLTPTLCDMLLRGFSTPRSYKVIVTSGQRINDDLFQRFDDQVGHCLINMYGSSEMGSIAACNPNDPMDTKIKTIGQPLETAKLRIHQPDPTTGIGELQCQNTCSFEGYIDESGAWLQHATQKEWFGTGDLASMSSLGYAELLGRAKNSINRNGYLVLFSDIERIMETFEDIAQVVILSSSEENERGQALIAFCIPKPGASLNSQQLRKVCIDKLPSYSIPDEVRIMASLPLLPSGKVDQQALQKMVVFPINSPTSNRPNKRISSLEDIIEELKYIIAEQLDVNIEVENIDSDIALLETGLSLDSIALVSLITFIKTSFKLEFRDDELNLEALQSVRTLSTWIYGYIEPQKDLEKEINKGKKSGQPVTHLLANVSLLHLRATTFGISHYDLLDANQNSTDTDSWSAALVKFAERYEAAAQDALAAKNLQSARQWWHMTVNYYHFSQMFIQAEQRNKYQKKCWKAYEQLASLVEPRCQRIAIPFKETTLPGYLRVAHPGAPCVILLGGFEFSKEAELHQCGEYFLERGMSVLCFDGPGQGEIANSSTMKGDFETVISAVIDFLDGSTKLVDVTRIGLFGISLGGYMAIRAATMDNRVTACISLSGPFDGRTTRNLAPRNQQTTARLFGFDNADRLADPKGPINLAALPHGITQPLFLIHSTKDHVVPIEQIELLQNWAQGETELWMLDDVEHCCFSRSREVLPKASDWMAKQLSAEVIASLPLT